MCGIAGILNLSGQQVDEARLARVRDTLRHRGPDGEGAVVLGCAALGHRRLAIVDVSGGAQPMSNEDGTVWIVVNGEIYNHAALRADLETRGHRFKTRSDSEVIVHLYEEEGERCVERLRGMFAFAVWDGGRGRLLLARDRLGIKPLYYARASGELVFASEIKAILASGAVRAAFNEAILPEYLATRFVAGEETFYRGIVKLLPGRTLTWSARDGFKERRYWTLPAVREDPPPTLREAAAEVRERLRESIRIHLMSDVPLGLFLSGGLDSSGLLALMAPMVKEPVRTFSVGFREPGMSELGFARLAAASVAAEHREVVLSPDEFFAVLPRLVWHEDEPIAFPSSVPLYVLSRLAREHVKVVLTGEGADELFLGYNRYRVTAWNETLARAQGNVIPGPVRGSVARLVQSLPRPVRRYAQRTFLALPPGPRGLFYENFAVFPGVLQRHLLADPGLLEARDPYAAGLRCYEEAPGGALDRMSRADLQTYLVELLMKQDQMSMAASIESRVPFLDHLFVEHVAALPGRYKLRGWRTKAVLREALRNVVPRRILARGKMGFPVPVGRWLRGPFWPLVREFVLGPRAAGRRLFAPDILRGLAEEHRSGAGEHGDRLWLLINLEIWQRIFIEGEEPLSFGRASRVPSSVPQHRPADAVERRA